MPRDSLDHLRAFLAVARERSFSRAAIRLGMSQSALSQTMRGLEARLGVRLLTRTTRNVAPTEAGERLLRAVGPAFDQIEAGLAALGELRDKPAGTIRITASEHGAETVLWPALEKLLVDYPDINVEVATESNLTNIVTERFDAGVRIGEHIEKDMVALRIGRRCAWQSLGRLHTSRSGQSPNGLTNSPPTSASTCAVRHAATIIRGSLTRRDANSRYGWRASSCSPACR